MTNVPQARKYRISVLILAAMASGLPVLAQSPGKGTDLAGIWNSATATPLERPARLKDKPYFTPAEATAWEREMETQNQDPTPEAAAKSVGTYNVGFREFGAHVGKTLRTSIITQPADGRIPALTPVAAADKRRREELLRHPDGAKDLGLQDQCLIFPTAVPPMIPYSYNSNYQIIQTSEALMIHAEMIHETRVIYLDGRPHPSPDVGLWLGDSTGHWEGSALVVDTGNFNDARGFYGAAGGMFGWDRHLHVVERFSLLDADTILYRFEVDDPTAFIQPWKGELTMQRASGPIYEYACHEGNYALPNLLRGYRADERPDAAGKPR